MNQLSRTPAKFAFQTVSKHVLGVTSKKKESPFKDIIQIKVDHPPTYPILDKLFFDKF